MLGSESRALLVSDDTPISKSIDLQSRKHDCNAVHCTALQFKFTIVIVIIAIL